jgi:hypothetical protein
MLAADDGEAEHGREGGEHQGTAQGVMAFGEGGHQRQNGEARHGGDGDDDTDPRRLDPDGLQPHREERQMSSEHPEQGAVKKPERAGKLTRRSIRYHGDL